MTEDNQILIGYDLIPMCKLLNTRLLIAVIFSCLLTLTVEAAELQAKQQLWFYFPTNLLVNENVEKGIELLRRAENAGYNGVLIHDSKFCRWGQLPDRYAVNVRRFREECRKCNIKCYAAVCPLGYSNDLLNLDPNLAEGLPVAKAPFVVKNGILVPELHGISILKNGGFEEYRNDKPTSWNFVDGPGKVSFIDENIKAEGKCSLRMQDIGLGETKNGRVIQALEVEPFQYFHISVQVKTEDFDSTGSMNIAVLGADDGMSLNHHFPAVQKTQDWTKIDITFNSLENKKVNLSIGTWSGGHGKVWWDDVKFEPAGFVNVLRREGTPLTVKSENGEIVYIEGIDFEKIVDPKMGNIPYPGGYTAWHEEPTVKIPPSSRLKEGQRVLADYFHSTIIYGDQVGCCMSEPKTRELLCWQIEQVHKNLEPDGYFLSHDEIRQQGWDKSCADTGHTPAEILADNVAFCVDVLRKEAPGKPIAVWSDMFDPTHNAKKDGSYYLVKGKAPWFGSWKKLPKDVLVANWNSNPSVRKESFKHFDDLGNPQILAGYYDAEPVEEMIQAWIRDAESFGGFSGVMYTTWENRYDALERFADAARKGWSK